MSCERIAELLPWFLKGTLDDEDERLVREHLEACETCRDELGRARTAWSLAEGHLPPETLVDLAMGGPMTEARRRLVESHLEQCDQCREELGLLQESPEEEVAISDFSDPRPLPSRESSGSVGLWQRFRELAAVLAILVCGAGWWWTHGQLAKERASLDLQIWDLQARIDSLKAPRLNVPVVDLLPGASGDVVRTGAIADPINTVRLPAEATGVALTLLLGDDEPGENFAVEICTLEGEILWRGEGLVRNGDGHLTLILPPDLLPRGRSTLRVLPPEGGEPVMRYEILTQKLLP